MLTPHDMMSSLQNTTQDYNLYVGIVKDVNDPNFQGRIRVLIPELYGNIATESIPWAQPSTPFGGGTNYGFVFIPPVNSKVFITFWRGYRTMPIWHGTHWFIGEMPTEARIHPPVNHVVKTPEGLLIDMHDGKPYIRIKDNHGNYIIINAEDDTIRIHIDQDMRTNIGVNADETVGGNKRLSIGANFDISVSGSVNLRASGQVNVDGSQINLNSGQARPRRPRPPKDVTHTK